MANILSWLLLRLDYYILGLVYPHFFYCWKIGLTLLLESFLRVDVLILSSDGVIRSRIIAIVMLPAYFIFAFLSCLKGRRSLWKWRLLGDMVPGVMTYREYTISMAIFRRGGGCYR